MEKNSLTFLSSRGTGLNTDLKMIQSELTKSFGKEGHAYRFFLKNEKSANPLARQGFGRAKKEFCRDMQHVICSDASLSSDLKDLEESAIRLLLAVPYDYQFKNMLALKKRKGEKREWKTFRNYTHIIPGSPFTSELFRSSYALTDIQMLENICMPSVWEMNQKENQQRKREQLQFYFPAMEGKKVFSILLYGEARKKHWLDQFVIREFVEKLGQGWFIVTNQPDIMESTYALKAVYADSFGYVNRILPVQDLLYVSDGMVTNNGRFASYFISRRKPVYCLDFKGNNFEKYMQECYPDLFLHTLSQILNIQFSTAEWSEELEHFYSQMTYKDLCCPYGIIRNLFGLSD